ncbi:RDD family protein [Daejeonella sp. H1SJ63]|uniref:RDD family protein n=1 Tax=Daejeonella sp. H1SJ63 TaxID=3034145 RepID=UPI0023EC60A3|nr:RDD family protein [Daejeonella sp. H1SJ63]
MDNKHIPLEIEGIKGNLYAGFWVRLASLLLDLIFMLPVIFVIQYLNGLGKNVYFYTLLPSLAFGFWYDIYLPKKYGWTPGKQVAGIKILRLDGKAIGWKEAILRHSVMFFLTLSSSIWMTMSLLSADDEIFKSLSWIKQTQYLRSLSPDFFKFYNWASNIWIYSEFIVLLLNKRKRAIHDYLAETVIVRSKYIEEIERVMNSNVTIEENDSTKEV